MIRWAVIVFVVVAIGRAVRPAPTRAATGPSLAHAVPAGAVAYGELAGLDRLIDQLRASRYYQLVVDSPQFQQVQKTPNFRKAQAARQIAETQLGMDLWSAAKLLGRRAALAIYPKPNRKQPDVLLIIRVAEAETFGKLLERLEPLLVLAEDQLKSSESAGGIRTISSADGKAHIAHGKDWLAAANAKELIDGCVALAAGSGRSLADDDSFAAMRKRIGADHLFTGYINTALAAKATGGRSVPQKLDNPVGSLLLSGELELAAASPYAAVTVDLEDNRFAVALSIAGETTKLPAPYQAFFSDPSSVGVGALPAVPGLVAGFSFYRDFAAWYQQREQFLQEQVLPGFDKFESGLANLLPGKKFGEDVLPLIGKTLTFVAAKQDYSHLDGKPGVQLPGFALVIELAKPEEGGSLMKLLFQTVSSIANLTAGEQGRQPMIMDLENYKGVNLSYGKYLQKPKADRLPISVNFTPAGAQVGNWYILSSSVDLCRKLIDVYQSQSITGGELPNRNLAIEVQAKAATDLIEANRELFVSRMIQQGRTSERAAAEFKLLTDVLRQFEAVKFRTGADTGSYGAVFEVTWSQ
jgi:hypothetical protein